MDDIIGNLSILQRELFVEWEILNYGENTCIKSEYFYFSGRNWFFLLEFLQSLGWVSLHLDILDEESNVESVCCELGIREEDGSVFCSMKSEAPLEKYGSFGSVKFLLLSEMSKCMSKDKGASIRVYCILRVLDHDSMKENSPALWHKRAHVDALAENLKDLYKRKCDSDVIINVKDKEFKAHKAILSSRSPVFKAMFESETKENISGVVDIVDHDPKSFERFLVYLYSGRVETLSCNDAYSLYVIADKYDQMQLKEEMLDFMIRDLSKDTFCDIVLLATSHNENELLKVATEFLIFHTLEILSTDEWLIFLRDHYKMANELFMKVCNYHKLSDKATDST